MLDTPISTDLLGYVNGLFLPADPTAATMTECAHAAGMPVGWEITPDVGRLFQIFCTMIGARRVLEFGTFAGHSALYFARALPEGGKVVSIELNAEYAAFARSKLADAGVGDKVDIRVMGALDALEPIKAEIAAGADPFDILFLDTEKAFYPTFLEWAPNALRPGGVLLADNVLRSPSWKGQALLDPKADDARIIAIREFNRQLAAHPHFLSTIVPIRAGVAVGVYAPV